MRIALRALWICGVAAVGCGDADPVADSGAGPPGDAATDRGTDAGPTGGGDGPCELNGLWAVQRVSFASVDSLLVPGAQKNSTWYLLDVEQHDDEIVVTRGLWCGHMTTGDATVTYGEDTIEAAMPYLATDGRRGSYRSSDSGCRLSLERVYAAVGVTPISTYLPGVEAPPGRIPGDPSLDELEPELPDAEGDPGAADWEHDGKPGVRYVISDSPLGSGVRHAVERGWHEIEGEISGDRDDFRVPTRYAFEQRTLEAMPEAFASTAMAREGAPHEARFLRVDSTIVGTDDLETCRNVREQLPHRPTPREAF